jgi:hypothetical protein
MAAAVKLALAGLMTVALASGALLLPPAQGLPPGVIGEVEALARVIRSEAGTSPLRERLHVAWATRNLASARGQSIAQMVCSPCGRQRRGRPVSSRHAGTAADRRLASEVLAAPPLLDATGGATHFINPALQDALARRAAPGYRGRPYRTVRHTWRRVYGWEPYYRLGPELEMWGPAPRP